MASPELMRPSSISPPPPVYSRPSPSQGNRADASFDISTDQSSSSEIPRKAVPLASASSNTPAYFQPPPSGSRADDPVDIPTNHSSSSGIPGKAIPAVPTFSNTQAYFQRPQPPVQIDGSIYTPQASSAVYQFPGDVAFDRPQDLDFSLANMKISENPHAGAPISRTSLPPRVDSIQLTASQVAAARHTSASTESGSLVASNERDDGSKRASTDRQDSALKAYHNSNSSDASLSSSQQMDYQPLQYYHRPLRDSPTGRHSGSSSTENLPHTSQLLSPNKGIYGLGAGISRPLSVYSSTSDLRSRSPNGSVVNLHGRQVSAHSPDSRPKSTYVELLQTPYPQQVPSPSAKNNDHLRTLLGNNVTLLSNKQTFDMYLANVKKTNDPAVQYEFAVFIISAIREIHDSDDDDGASILLDKEKDISPDVTRSRLLLEAKAILQRLADRSYPFAQYYLADGLSSGLFSKGKVDYDRALPLFVAASKHGHAESSYRAGLCNEFGWGCRVEASKAANFYRAAATKNHPGAMLRLGRACLTGELGLGKRYREGIKWLKRATDAADSQYNAAPYELGLLHETGYGQDIFKDEAYAAQLFTKSADLGHIEANFRMGEAYEHGHLGCPHDPALSIHFYTAAAQADHPQAQMALCAWYLLGADPVLERDEGEAYEWARKAAERGLAKAQYTVGFFTESGIGCRRDPLEANVWYVKAADQGEDRAKHRLAAIQAASDGANPASAAKPRKKNDNRRPSEGKKEKSKFLGIF